MTGKPFGERRFEHNGHTVVAVWHFDASKPARNASVDFTIFGKTGTYEGGLRLLYTKLEQDLQLDAWVFEQGRQLIRQRLDLAWDFGLAVTEHVVDPTALPRNLQQ